MLCLSFQLSEDLFHCLILSVDYKGMKGTREKQRRCREGLVQGQWMHKVLLSLLTVFCSHLNLRNSKKYDWQKLERKEVEGHGITINLVLRDFSF